MVTSWSAARSQAPTLRVRSSLTSYLKFTVTGVQAPVRVTLRLNVTDSSPAPITVRKVADTAWTESAITWQSAPALGAVIGTATAPVVGGWMEVDLGMVSANGTYSYALTSADTDAAWFSSTEGANPPQLLASPA